MKNITVRICNGRNCCKKNKDLLVCAEKKGVQVEKTACMGACKKAPNIQIVKDGKTTTHHAVHTRKLEDEIDISTGKKERQKPVGHAKNAVNNLLSGGF